MARALPTDRICALCCSSDRNVSDRVVETEISPDYAWSNGIEELEYGDGTRSYDPLRKPEKLHRRLRKIGVGKKGKRLFALHARPHLSGMKTTVPWRRGLKDIPFTLAFVHDPNVPDGWACPFRYEASMGLMEGAIHPSQLGSSALLPLETSDWEANPEVHWMAVATPEEAPQDDESKIVIPGADHWEDTTWDIKVPTPGPRTVIFVHWDCMQVLLTQLVGKRIDADITPDDWLSLNHKALAVAMYSIFEWHRPRDTLRLWRRMVNLASGYEYFFGGEGPTPFVKPGVLQKVLTRMLFRTPRFQHRQRVRDRKLTGDHSKNEKPMGPVLSKLPMEVLLLVLSYLEPKEIRSTQLVCQSFRLLFQSEEFWRSWLRLGAYNRILPELMDAMEEGVALYKEGDALHPQWRQVAGWLEAISMPIDRQTGWGLILECRLRILQTADVVCQRYKSLLSSAPWTLETPQNTYCMTPITLVSKIGHSRYADSFNPEYFKNHPSVSVSLVPSLNGGTVRIGSAADKPVIQLLPYCDPGDSNILKADDIIVLIEFGISEEAASRFTRMVHIKLYTKNGSILSLVVPGCEQIPAQTVVFYHAPSGFLFLDQIYCPKSGMVRGEYEEDTQSSSPGLPPLEIVAFRGVTVGPPTDKGDYYNSPLTYVYWSTESDYAPVIDLFTTKSMVLVPHPIIPTPDNPMYLVYLESPEELTEEPLEWCIYRHETRAG